MKKLILTVLIVTAVSAAAFAQSYALNKVTGTIEYLDGKDWKAVSEKTALSSDTQLRSKRIGSSLEITQGAELITIRPLTEGKTVSELLKNVKQISSNSTYDASEASRERGSAITASARASDAQAALRIEEE